MSLTAKLVAFVKDIDRKIWPDHRVVIAPQLAQLLMERNLIVADVGSADGPEERWLSLKQYIHFLTFEPNPRQTGAQSENHVTNFPIGLWSKKGKHTLYVTRHPDSSSLFPINTKLFANYMVRDGMEMDSTADIELDSLDEVLAPQPELSPDFLKIDVEGADLEVLKGAEKCLAETVLGLKIETSFPELHIGAPTLWEIDAFMRERGFALFYLSRVQWVRVNGLHGFTSEPQLIWGDAIYFLSRDKFLERLAARNESERKALLAKFVVILLRHGVHDYAWELVEAAATASNIPSGFAEDLKTSIKRSMDTSIFYFIKGLFAVAFAFAILLVSVFFPEPRKRSIYYLKQKAGRLSYDLCRRACLGGRVHHSCIEDPFV